MIIIFSISLLLNIIDIIDYYHVMNIVDTSAGNIIIIGISTFTIVIAVIIFIIINIIVTNADISTSIFAV